MVTNYNSALSREIRDVAKLQTGKDNLPSEIRNEIMPVIDVNPKHARVIDVVAFKNANGTIYTTPANQDFYYVGSFISGALTTASTGGTITIAVTPKGGVSTIVNAVYPRTTALIDGIGGSNTVMLPIPILLERNSTILLAQGNVTIGVGTIFGYVIDNSGA